MKKILSIVLATFLFASCSSDKVMTGAFIQKRKYNKGFYIANLGSKKTAVNTEAQVSKSNVVSVEKMNTLTANTSSNDLEISSKPVSVFEKLSKKEETTQVDANTSSFVSKQTTKRAEKLERKLTKLQKKLNTTSSSDDDDKILYYLLAFFIPFVAVGLVTDWDMGPVLLNLLLCFLCWIPGMIHAFMVVSKHFK